jgi:tRNA nucleotidyltransferase (CCA-adding enzyme)
LTISTYERLIEYIRISIFEISKVSAAKNNLVDVINNKAQDVKLPLAEYFSLIGSYKRGTKITPLDDVDIFYVIGKAKKTSDNWHSITKCSFNFDGNFMDENNNVSSLKVLNLIKQEIYETYSSSQVRRNQEVVNVYLSSYEVGFDIVPDWKIENENYYLMPVGEGKSRWKRTDPFKDEYIINNLNKKHNELLKEIIKIMKYWCKKKRIKSPRSYHLEAIIYNIFINTDPIYNYTQGLEICFSYLLAKKELLTWCPDPTGLSEALQSGLTGEDIDNILSEARIALMKLQNGEEEFVNYVEPNL